MGTPKEIDKEGQDILEALSNANKLNRLMYDTIEPYCSGKTLEIGSGIGNISQFFIKEKKDIFLSDLRENYRQTLRNKFSLSNDRVLELDLVHPDFERVYADKLGTFDTVFALNVVEHIKDDQLALKNVNKLLKEGGKAVILVPAFNLLYNGIDKSLEHYRRYTKRTLEKVMTESFEIESYRYFNALGILGWFGFGSVLQQKTIKEDNAKLYEMLMPIGAVLDKLLIRKIGLSVIMVGIKK